MELLMQPHSEGLCRFCDFFRLASVHGLLMWPRARAASYHALWRRCSWIPRPINVVKNSMAVWHATPEGVCSQPANRTIIRNSPIRGWTIYFSTIHQKSSEMILYLDGRSPTLTIVKCHCNKRKKSVSKCGTKLLINSVRAIIIEMEKKNISHTNNEGNLPRRLTTAWKETVLLRSLLQFLHSCIRNGRQS